MKRSFLLLFVMISVNLFGQNMGCDGSRYVANTFAEVQMNTVQFGSNTNILGLTQNLFMDIYQPTGDVLAKRPLIIMAHGGSFIAGTRQDLDATCREYAKKGYVTATVDYRLWPLLFGFPDSTDILGVVVSSVHDMKAATRYFYADAQGANDYRIDTNYILIGGYSAGAIAALHTAYLDENDSVSSAIQDVIDGLGGLEGSSGNPGFSSTIKGALNFSGALHKASWMSAGEVPLVSIHGTGDATVPFGYGIANSIVSVEGSSVLKERANLLGIPNLLYDIFGGGHVNIYSESLYATQREEFAYLASAFLHDTIICAGGIILGQNAPNGLATLAVSPNPATTVVNIAVPENIDALHVKNLMGQTMTLLSATSSQIDVANWPTGMYVLTAIKNNGVVAVSKFVKE